MRLPICLALGILLVVVESSVLSFLPIEFFKPDFGTPIIIYATLFLGPQAGLVAALILGLLQEILSNAPSGSIIFTKLSIFIIAAFLKSKLYIDSKYSFAYTCSGFVVLESLVFLTLSLLSKGETGNILNVLFYTVPNAIFTGFLSIFIFAFIQRVETKLLDRE